MITGGLNVAIHTEALSPHCGSKLCYFYDSLNINRLPRGGSVPPVDAKPRAWRRKVFLSKTFLLHALGLAQRNGRPSMDQTPVITNECLKGLCWLLLLC